MGVIYGKVNTIDDISRINCIIRDEMLAVESKEQLTDLKKRSDYLCTLTYSPFWKKKFGDQIEEVRRRALEENRVTVRTANYVAKYKGWDVHYDPWGKKHEEIDEALKEIPERILEEYTTSLVDLELSPDILDDLRKMFCDLRKAAVLCEDLKCLNRIKKLTDLVSMLPHLESFAGHFTGEELKAIDLLIHKERERSILLFNIIATVNNWDAYYEMHDFDEEKVKEEVEKILEEEQKADTYIPTEVKYKAPAKVIWVVYYHPKRKREYAKRVYIPGNAENIKIEGPGIFKNRFGNEVYGIRITYEIPVRATVIRIRGREIRLPERKIKRSKVVPLPEVAQNIRITEERPPSAMAIA
ncbi:MAG: hypothetical protein GXO27_01205 [Chlorobi bacterium]|nr:hypothetical protein [Chlorobiota bacterium]